MGRLISKEEMHANADWYISDIWHSSKGPVYSWPNTTYYGPVSIHTDVFKENNALKIKIRKWIETSIADTVVYDLVDKSYYKKIFTGDYNLSGYNVSNEWILFYFEDKESSLLFKLIFGQYTREMSDKHPDDLE